MAAEQADANTPAVGGEPRPSAGGAAVHPWGAALLLGLALLGGLIWLGIVRHGRRARGLSESEAKYRALIETTDTGFVILDSQGRVLDANQEYVRICGHDNLEQISGRSVVEWTSPEDAQRNAQEVARCMAQGHVRDLELTYVLPGGAPRPVEINATVMDSGGRKLIFSVVRDITQRRQAEESLRAGDAIKDLLLNASPDPFFLMDTKATILLANEALGQRLGKPAAELVGQKAFTLLDPQVFPRVREYFFKALKSGQPNHFDEQWLGSYVHFRHVPILDALGGVVEIAVFTRDISERVQAEEALRKSEEKHRLVLEESSDPIFSFDRDGTYLYVNKAFSTPLGKKPQDIVGKRIWDIFSQEEADRRFSAVRAVFDTGETRVLEVRVPREPEDLYFVTSVKPVKDERGRVLTVICVSKDITRRKQAEEALKESEERFRVMSEQSPLGISLLDQRGVFEYVNPAFVKMFGYTLDELRSGGGWFALAYPDPQYRRQVIAAWLQDLDKLPAGEVRPRTYEVRCRDQSQKTIFFRPVTIGTGRQFIIYEDVTDRLKAERALVESERRYRELFDSMSDLIYTQDMQGRFLSVNPALAAIFGYEASDLLGHKASDFMKPEFRDDFEKHYLDELAVKGHHFGTSLYFAADGRRRYIEYQSSVVRPPDGPPYISGVGRDITERIESEKQLAQLQEQLFQSQKIEALGVLAGGIAHDFNNVLQAISGYTQLMMVEPGLPANQRERLEHVEQHIVRATGMIRHLMTLARKGQTHLERVDLNQEVARVVRILEHTLPRMIQINTVLAPDLRRVSADCTQVEQVLLNLATNANQAMPHGGELTFITQNLTLNEDQAKVQGLVAGEYICLQVADTGLGMDEETLSRIYEPFFTTKPRGQGTGLGLATVYGIVSNYGGHIRCDSRPHRGTVFTINLPAATGDAPAAPEPPCDSPQAPAGSETILVVDDEAAILETCRQALNDYGYGVLTATSGEEALETYLGSPQSVALIIMDLSMPGMGGLKCLEAMIKAQPTAKVLIATGYADEAVTRRIEELGASGLLAKPYRFSDLLAKVRALLDTDNI